MFRAAALLAAAVVVAAPAGSEPIQKNYTEKVEVRLIGIDATAWPESGGVAACEGLAAEDFELKVNGRKRAVVAVDRAGPAKSTGVDEGTAAGSPAPGSTPLSIVLYFDLWHLNVFYREFQCPMTKQLAFEAARKLVREQFRPGDRLLLVTFSGWPQVHEGWIRDPGEALAALDRLEVNPLVLAERQEHLHHQEWLEGMRSLILALGRYPGRKEVFYLGDDFRFDDVAVRVFDLAERAQSNRVTVHAVDLLASCRNVPGPPCTRSGGLGCTPFRDPIALAYLADGTGGRVLGSDSISDAVRRVREVEGCRYVVYFKDEGSGRRSPPKISLQLTKKGLMLHAPQSFQDPSRPPAERDEKDALFLLPLFGKGLSVEAGLWPIKPSGKGRKWNALIVARIHHVPGEEWPDDLKEIVVDAAAFRASKFYGQFRKVIVGPELEALRAGGKNHVMVFPVEGVPPGETSIDVRAFGTGGVAANVRASYTVVDPPAAGEAAGWVLVDRVARLSDQATLLPSLDAVVPQDRPLAFLAYGCRGSDPSLAPGMLVGPNGVAPVEVPIDWLAGPGGGAGACGWLIARVAPPLAAGLWRFAPPPSASATPPSASVEFRIAN